MLHWSATDEPASQTAAEPTIAANTAMLERPPLLAVERITEILERFFLNDPRLTTELLQELSRCDAPTLMKLFGCSPSTPVPASAGAEPEHGPIPSNSGPELSGALLQQANPPPTVWDERGYRISPRLPSAFAFTRHYETPQRRGTHWSR
jgi:hypothetical protein